MIQRQRSKEQHDYDRGNNIQVKYVYTSLTALENTLPNQTLNIHYIFHHRILYGSCKCMRIHQGNECGQQAALLFSTNPYKMHLIMFCCTLLTLKRNLFLFNIIFYIFLCRLLSLYCPLINIGNKQVGIIQVGNENVHIYPALHSNAENRHYKDCSKLLTFCF